MALWDLRFAAAPVAMTVSCSGADVWEVREAGGLGEDGLGWWIWGGVPGAGVMIHVRQTLCHDILCAPSNNSTPYSDRNHRKGGGGLKGGTQGRGKNVGRRGVIG